MRLIDAEKCPCKGCGITYCNENCKRYYAWLDGCDYDVKAKVAELEELADYNGNAYLDCADVLEIVRGKE